MRQCGSAGGEWPLIGRTAELQRIGEYLDRGVGGVVLAGPAGVGKTRLALEGLSLASARGFVPIRVAATQATAKLPFGAFAPLLPDVAAGTDLTEVLRQVGRAIVRSGEGKPVALLVDDAHLLDEASAALTYQMAVANDTFVLTTVRSGERASEAVVALWKDAVAGRLELGPLSAEEVGQFVEAVLGGPASGAVSQRFFELSEGNALFLRELVLAALESGNLRHEGGIWRLHGPLPASARLVELLASRLAGVGEAEREALQVLAISEPMGVEPFQALSGLDDVEALEARQLVRVDRDGRRFKVRLVHPLYGEVLRARLSPLRTRALARAIADVVEATGMRRREDVLRVATWRLEAGGVLEPKLMLTGARLALAGHDLDLADRLARAAVEAGGGFDAALLAAQVLNLRGRVQEAEAELATLNAWTTNDSERGLVAVTRMDNLTYGLGRYDEALRVGEEAEASISERAWLHEIAARRAAILIRTEGPRAAAEASEPVRREGQGRAFVWASIFGGIGLAKMGRLEAALEAAANGHRAYLALTGPQLQWPPEVMPFVRVEALLHAGHLHEAESEATGAYRQALAEGVVEMQAVHAWQLAKVLLARGRVAAAVRLGREAAGLLRDLRRPPFLAYALTVVATAHALRGEVDEAQAGLSEIERIALPRRNVWAVEALQARAWTVVAAGDLVAARHLLKDAARLGLATGDRAGEAAALHDLARLGAGAQVVDQLGAAAADMEGDLAGARASHAVALVGGDPAGLEQVSARFRALGADLLAAEAAADAAVLYRRVGDRRKAAAAEREARALARCCEGALTPALGVVTVRATLSRRELEIARLAAAGVANKEIARRLCVSLHTVQNTLHASYEKLGVHGRAELAQALEGY
ncbi:MAG: LuxR C-terminal-related transcriptional regulator [Actinomycetota bacterium]